MALFVNSSLASGISEIVIVAMTNLNRDCPDKWRSDWLASLIPAQDNDNWELKLTAEDGTSRRRIFSDDQQGSGPVCANLIELRDEWDNES